MNHLMNLLLIGDKFVRLAGVRPDGVQVVELLTRDGVYFTAAMYQARRTWSHKLA